MSDFEGKAMYIKLEREIYTDLKKNNLKKKKAKQPLVSYLPKVLK